MILGSADALLLCRSSNSLPIPDKSVDAIITDPPYYDNLIYSGLSDLYYIWLSYALRDSYHEFNRDLTPREEEAVVDPSRKDKKGHEFYVNSLKKIFREANRVLKDDGLLVMTFHHLKSKAWEAVFESLLDSGFVITATWPVRSEAKSYPHTKGKGAALYDAVIVGRKRLVSPKPAKWEDLRTKAENRARDRLSHLKIVWYSPSTLLTIATGAVLEEYSYHYPMITIDNRSMSIKDAVEEAIRIVKLLGKEVRFARKEHDKNDLTKFFM